MTDRAGWVEYDTDDNAISTASRAAETGRQHVIYGLAAGFSAAPGSAKTLQIKDGTTVIWQASLTVGGLQNVTFPAGIAITRGNEASAVLAASGTGGNVGSVAIHGITR